MDERLYWLWLAKGLGFASRHLNPLLEQTGGAEGAYRMRERLLAQGLVAPAQQKQLLASEPRQFAPQLEAHLQAGYTVLCYDAPQYPTLLREIFDPPAVLYAEGQVQWLNAALPLAMVGTRRPSAYGVEAARTLGKGLAGAGAVLVSGLAEGLDSEAHKAALAAGTPTVAVLGTAIDRCYPARNATLRGLIAKNGVILSEYPIGTTGSPNYFLLRNRIIAGLARGVIVTEARRRSGTMSTVRFALEGGRDVFAVPGSIFSPLSEGTNWLLSQGAKAVQTAGDVLCDYGVQPPAETIAAGAEAPPPLSAGAAAVYACLTAQPQPLAALCAACGLLPGAAMAALTELELAGLSCQLAGRLFVKNG